MTLLLLVLIAFFSNSLEMIFPLMTYTDEIIPIVLLSLILINYKKVDLSILTNIEKKIIFLSVISFIITVWISITSDFKPNNSLLMYSVFASYKYIVIYFLGRVYISTISKKILPLIKKTLLIQSYFFVSMYLVLYFTDYFLNFFKEFSVRYGFKNVSFGFEHPAEFAMVVILQVSLNLYINASLNKKIDWLFLCFSTLLIFFTGRLTALAFMAVILVLIISYRYFRRYVLVGLIASGTLGVIISWEKINDTFISNLQPRGVLLNTGIRIANDFFPSGSGLGTFGSNASRIEYSDIYYIYGISNSYGLSPTYSAFITDSYWSSVLGEVGYIVGLISVLILLLLFINSYRMNIRIVGLFISIPVLYAIISSPIDTILVSNSAFPVFLISALLVTLERSKSIDERES